MAKGRFEVLDLRTGDYIVVCSLMLKEHGVCVCVCVWKGNLKKSSIVTLSKGYAVCQLCLPYTNLQQKC